MNCPVCRRNLSEIEYESVNVHGCEDCGGEFIGARDLAHVINIRQERFPREMTEAAIGHAPRFGVPDVDRRRALNCPSCSGRMSVINYCGDSGVFADRCDDCGGIWLDVDELENIQVLMEQWSDESQQKLGSIAGDLDLARQRAAESTSGTFSTSRFAFVNALFNRFFDAA